MDELNIVEYLASKGKHGKRGPGNEMIYACFFDCGRNDDDRKKKLYVNTEEGWYSCKVCGSEGGTFLLQKHFGDTPERTKIIGVNNQARREILNSASVLGAENLLANDDVLLYLISRGLEAETIERYQLGFIGNGWSLAQSLEGNWTKEDIRSSGLVHRDGQRQDRDVFWNHILIPYQSRGQIVQIRGRIADPNPPSGTPKYLSGPAEPVRIYNSDDLDCEDVIVTEGEFDCLVVRQLLDKSTEEKYRNIGVVGLSGSGALPENLESLFSNVKRIYTGFDPDKSGVKGAQRLKDALGARVRDLSFPPDIVAEAFKVGKVDSDIDWSLLVNEFGLTWRHVVSMISTASGKRVFSMAEARLRRRTLRSGKPNYQTGIGALDDIIDGGMHAGQLMVLMARTGVGKTTLLCNLAYYMRSYRILFISLEMTQEEVAGVMEKIYYFHNPKATSEAIDSGLGNVYIFDENRIDDQGLNQIIDEYEVEVGARPEIVMVDYLGYFARSATGSTPYEKTSNAVMQLKAAAKGGGSSDPRKRFVCISPTQANRTVKEGKPLELDSARESGVIEETADFFFSLWRPGDAVGVSELGGEVQRSNIVMLDVLKSRHGGRGRNVQLVWDETFLVMAEYGDHSFEAKRVKSHNTKAARGVTYEKMRAEEDGSGQSAMAL
jgi:hypothetical protein